MPWSPAQRGSVRPSNPMLGQCCAYGIKVGTQACVCVCVCVCACVYILVNMYVGFVRTGNTLLNEKAILFQFVRALRPSSHSQNNN